MSEMRMYVHDYRDKLLADPYRPRYHFAAMDSVNIGDPNGAFYADGRYHLMYLYVTKIDGRGDHCAWGHVSSSDLVHWCHHKDPIAPYEGDLGCYSGGAFVDDDGTAYITFFKFPSVNGKDNGGTAIAYAKPPYDDWTRIEPIAINCAKEKWGLYNIEIGGEIVRVGVNDPSNIWKMNGYYYLETGNKAILDTYGRKPDSEQRYKGGWTELFKSKDLKNWEYVHRFIDNTYKGSDWPDETEDHMCSCVLPLPDKQSDGVFTDKWLELFISHNIGSQYFIGEVDEKKEKFMPLKHGRFTWNDRSCFAPEAMLDHKNRQIAWFVLNDDLCDYVDEYDWYGVYTLPRCLWYENEQLHMFPVDELKLLQTNHQIWEDNISEIIPVKNGRSCHIHAEFASNSTNECGLKVLYDENNKQGVRIFYDHKRGKLVFDGSACGEMGKKRKENHRWFEIVDVEEAPFALKDGETLELDVWIDNAVVEVYANKRQAICRRFFADCPSTANSVSVIGGNALEKLEAWEMQHATAY